jgi:hypothetical protein
MLMNRGTTAVLTRIMIQIELCEAMDQLDVPRIWLCIPPYCSPPLQVALQLASAPLLMHYDTEDEGPNLELVENHVRAQSVEVVNCLEELSDD